MTTNHIHRCTEACEITWQIETEDGDFVGEFADEAQVRRIVEQAAADRVWLQTHEVCNTES